MMERLSLAVSSGFTLLELLTVLSILGLLALGSYPIYTHHLLKTHRTEAQVSLFDLASALDRYYLVNNTYKGATLETLEINEDTPNHYYRLAIASLTDDSYLLRAIPIGSQAKDSYCGDLTLNQLGERSSSGKGGNSNCW